jgi:hypothetical protein
MKESERAKFIVELFQIDTDGLDSELIRSETKAQNLRSSIKTYGDAPFEIVEKPDYEGLELKRTEIRNTLNEQYLAVKPENEAIKANFEADKKAELAEILAFNDEQKAKDVNIRDLKRQLFQIKDMTTGNLFERYFDFAGAQNVIEKLPKPQPAKEVVNTIPEPIFITIDDSELKEIDAKIASLEIQNVKYDNYLKESAREEEKMKLTGELKALVEQIRIMRIEKAHKQESINGIIEGLEYKDFQIWYENTTFEMLSTSQLMKLSSALSALYPESLGLELIDRGESMGKSIYSLIEKAEKEDKNILVTIVGDKPAESVENVGVFVVENGTIQ